jgi:DNA-binding MarR family transcriptional regulator
MNGNPSRDVEELDALVTALLTASRALIGVSARSIADVEDAVTLTQFRALVVLGGHGAVRLSELADELGVGASSALRTIDRLQASGYVSRQEDDTDRRAVSISLTAAGRRLVDTVTSNRRAAIADIVEAMPAARRRGLVTALTAFAEAAGEPVATTDGPSATGW